VGDLDAKKRHGDRDQSVDQALEQRGLGVHHALDHREITRGRTFYE